MNRIHWLLLHLGLTLAAAHSAGAEPTPLNKMSCGSVAFTPILESEAMGLVTWSSINIIRDQSERGEPDVSERCVGTTLRHGERSIMRGYCLSLNPNGDQVLVELAQEGEAPINWRVVDGTGGAAGMTGEGSARLVTEARPIQAGTQQYCYEVEGSTTVQQ